MGVISILTSFISLCFRVPCCSDPHWTSFALRWAFPTALDYYEVLRPHIATSGAATPAPTVVRASYAGSQVPLMCLSLDVGSIYAPVVVRAVVPLYRQTMRAHIPCHADEAGGQLQIPCHPYQFAARLMVTRLSDDGSSPNRIQARLAASPQNRVLRLCLRFPRGFTQLRAQVRCVPDSSENR